MERELKGECIKEEEGIKGKGKGRGWRAGVL